MLKFAIKRQINAAIMIKPPIAVIKITKSPIIYNSSTC